MGLDFRLGIFVVLKFLLNSIENQRKQEKRKLGEIIQIWSKK